MKLSAISSHSKITIYCNVRAVLGEIMVGQSKRSVSPKGPYTNAWRDYRMRMKLPWLLILVFAVLPFVADKMIRIGVSVYVFAPIFVTLMVAIVIAWIRVWLFPSPKCGKVFRKLTEFPYPSHCRHCGLEKFDDGKETPAIAVHEMAQQQNGSYINTTRLATDAKGVEKS